MSVAAVTPVRGVNLFVAVNGPMPIPDDERYKLYEMVFAPTLIDEELVRAVRTSLEEFESNGKNVFINTRHEELVLQVEACEDISPTHVRRTLVRIARHEEQVYAEGLRKFFQILVAV